MEPYTMPFHSLLKEISRFEQREVEAVFEAFEAAANRLNLSQRDNPQRKLLAITVVECARSGERDPERLSKMVLAALQRGVCTSPNISSLESSFPLQPLSPQATTTGADLPIATTKAAG
jgi:hypothetical protein